MWAMESFGLTCMVSITPAIMFKEKNIKKYKTKNSIKHWKEKYYKKLNKEKPNISYKMEIELDVS